MTTPRSNLRLRTQIRQCHNQSLHAWEVNPRRQVAMGSILLIAALVTSCGSQTASNPAGVPGGGGDRTINKDAITTAQSLQPPMVPATNRLQPVPVPNLIPPTTAPDRLPTVAAGRPDPFSTLLVTPTLIETQAQPSSATAPSLMPSVPLSPPPLSTAPTVAVAPLPAFQPGTLPTFQPGAPIVVPSRPVNPVSTAQAIEVSGVVQTGSKTSIILKVPDERTSRYVSVGDRLANGRILVKRVEMGAEPVVILEQDGREIVKSIGNSGGSVVGSL